MSLLICSPVYNQPQQAFAESIQILQETLLASNFEHQILYITGESLIQRARDNAVAAFLQSKYERFLFIDSDLEFNPEDVQKLWNLNEDVCCASYPMRMMRHLQNHPQYNEVKGIIGHLADKLVYPVPSTAWKDGKMVDLDQLNGPTEVDFAPTGFLMIKRHIFEEMKAVYPEKSYMAGLPGGDFKLRRECHAWFDAGVSEGKNVEDRILLSEDYAFSRDFRNMGGKIILDPSIRLKHWGQIGYGE